VQKKRLATVRRPLRAFVLRGLFRHRKLRVYAAGERARSSREGEGIYTRNCALRKEDSGFDGCLFSNRDGFWKILAARAHGTARASEGHFSLEAVFRSHLQLKLRNIAALDLLRSRFRRDLESRTRRNRKALLDGRCGRVLRIPALHRFEGAGSAGQQVRRGARNRADLGSQRTEADRKA